MKKKNKKKLGESFPKDELKSYVMRKKKLQK